MAAPISSDLIAATIKRPAGAVAPGGDPITSAQQMAWRREMERAQATEWFRSGPRSAPQASPGGHPVDGSVEGPIASRTPVNAPAGPTRFDDARSAAASVVSLAGDGVSTVDARLPPGSADPLDRTIDGRFEMPAAPGPQGRLVSAFPRKGAGDATTTEAMAALKPSIQEAASMSVHTEVTRAGTCVWLGMREGDPVLAAMLPKVLADLQRGFEERGQRLHQVVCNGRVIWGGEPTQSGFQTIYSKEP